jgi:hypothetical protein
LRQRITDDMDVNENLPTLRNNTVSSALWRSPVLRLHNFKRALLMIPVLAI